MVIWDLLKYSEDLFVTLFLEIFLFSVKRSPMRIFHLAICFNFVIVHLLTDADLFKLSEDLFL